MVLIFLSMFGVMFLITQYFQLVLGYSAARRGACASCRCRRSWSIVATQTPKLAARFGAHRTVAAGMALVAVGLFMFRGLEVDTPYLYVLACIVPLTSGIAMAMSPMTASIMSAVPARRAGTGSAMNDATRELGAALGVAVLGSLAASHYAHSFHSVLDAGAGGLARPGQLVAGRRARRRQGARRRRRSRRSRRAASSAFVDGIHFAVTIGASLAADRRRRRRTATSRTRRSTRRRSSPPSTWPRSASAASPRCSTATPQVSTVDS